VDRVGFEQLNSPPSDGFLGYTLVSAEIVGSDPTRSMFTNLVNYSIVMSLFQGRTKFVLVWLGPNNINCQVLLVSTKII
jgi:hypothetical protein